jgi:TetR/AcrR family transcriptional regulator, copper-responsive repressor
MNKMQDGTKRSRGRPREFDPDEVLDRALALFWRKGFSATSLDDLCEAMDLNRPSLYRAFGDKRALYRRALARFVGRMEAEVGVVFAADVDLATALLRFYEGGIELYLSADPAPGCFVVCTAPVEAIVHADVREDLEQVIATLDRLLEKRFAEAARVGRLASGLAPASAAKLAHAVLHTLAIRARAGEPRAALRAIARNAVALLAAPDPRGAARRAPRRAAAGTRPAR